jgi:hypothetical protein
MSSTTHGALLITGDLLDFLCEPISIKAGSCSMALVPSVAQAYGCRVSQAHGEVCVFLSASRASSVLRDLREGGALSVVFSRPATHRTVQFKAQNARIEPLQDGDEALIRRHGQRAMGELISLGYAPAFSQALMAPEITDAICVCFAPDAAFDQTPGAAAGQPLRTSL